VGDRAVCLLRDCDVIITSWTDALIPWPRCRALHQLGGSGLLLADDLARAVRTESALAVGHWWRVHSGVVWRWRKCLGVGRTDNEGSRRLIEAAVLAGAEAMRQRGLTEEECDQRTRRALELDLARYLKTGYHGPRWTAQDLALLGTMSDDRVAERIGRTAVAVRAMRGKLGIPTAQDRRRAR
jgi:hypothetical protein